MGCKNEKCECGNCGHDGCKGKKCDHKGVGDCDFNSYQKKAAKYDRFEPTDDLTAPGMFEKVLGLAGEAGEVADKVKKIVRDKKGKITDEDRLEIAKELGDVMWYVAGISRYLNIPLSEVAQMNLDKLESRLQRGKIGGSGDNR